jgi:hypothetical protein
MKHYPPPQPRSPAKYPKRIPLFHAVPVRARADGWTPRRQAQFIGHLAETKSVSAAARRVSMARETAYRLRGKKWADGFCRAWDAALGKQPGPAKPMREVTLGELQWRVLGGLWHVHMYQRRFCGLALRADNDALLSLAGRFARMDLPASEDLEPAEGHTGFAGR